jgi:hypothetical protein
MGEDRLNGLASLNILRNINVNINQALNQFFSVPHRVNLLKKLFVFYSFVKKNPFHIVLIILIINIQML